MENVKTSLTKQEEKIYNAIVESLLEGEHIDCEDDLITTHKTVELITSSMDSLEKIEFIMCLERKLQTTIKDENIELLIGLNMESLIQKIKTIC